MDDTTLLKLAGKAAGENYGPDNNPIERDDLALRLAVKVGILIAPPAYNGGWQATASAKADETAWIDDTSGSHEESTRRAIVRAAAEIGKAMP
jgi:hypothetical protein